MSHLHFGRAVPIVFRRLPQFTAQSAIGEQFEVPVNLKGKLNMLIIGFRPLHAKHMRTWMPVALKVQHMMNERYNDSSTVSIYALIIRNIGARWFPLISNARWQQLLCEESECNLKPTEILFSFLNVRDFVDKTQLPDSQRAYFLLVKANGEICWCEHENYDKMKTQPLQNLLRLQGTIDDLIEAENRNKILMP